MSAAYSLNNGTVSVTPNAGNVSISVSNALIVVAQGDNITLSGSSDTIQLSNGEHLSIVSGTNNTVQSQNGSITVSATSASTTVDGNGNSISASTGDNVAVSGSSNVISLAEYDSANSVSGNLNTVSLTGGIVIVQANDGTTIIDGNGDYIQASSGNNVDVNGYYNGIILATADSANILSGGYDYISITSGAINVAANVLTTTLVGNGDYLDATSGDTIDIEGYYIGLSLASGDSVTYSSGGYGVISNSNITIDLAAQYMLETIAANNDTVTLSANDTIWLETGVSGAIIDASSLGGDTIMLVGGDQASVSGPGAVIDILGNGSTLSASGSNTDFDAIVLSAGITAALSGIDDVISGSNDTINASAFNVTPGADQVLTGSNDTINFVDQSYDVLDVTGNNNTITANNAGDQFYFRGGIQAVVKGGSSLDLIWGNNTGLTLSGSTVLFGWSGLGYINGSVNGNGNSIQFRDSGTGSALTVNGNSNSIQENDGPGEILYLNGGGNAVTLGSDDTLVVDANQNVVYTNVVGRDWATISMATDITATINGPYDVIYGSADTINANGSFYASLFGNDNLVNFESNAPVNLALFGAGETINTTFAGDVINFFGGASGTINGSGVSSWFLGGANGATATFDGNNNTVWENDGGVNEVANVTGNNNTLNLGIDDSASATVNGNNNTINGGFGDTVTLSANDSGDVINMIGGTIVVGAGVTNITVKGTGDNVSGPGASSIGYSAGNIQDLVNFFGQNQNLSENQIIVAESDPSFRMNLANYLNNATIYNGSNALNPNILAMLEGYSSLYTSLFGPSASVIDEAVYIEQQFEIDQYSAVATNQGVSRLPTDGLTAIFQNILQILSNPAPGTSSLIPVALNYLEAAQASFARGDSGGTIQDALIAKLALEAVEGLAKSTGNTQEEVTLDTSFTDIYKIIVTPDLPAGNGSGKQIYVKNEGSGKSIFSQLLDILSVFVPPVVDAAALATGNWEIIGAASALSFAEGGAELAAGNDIPGVLSILGGLSEALSQAPAGSDAAVLGSYLSEATASVQSYNGLSAGSDESNIFSVIGSALNNIGAGSGQNDINTFEVAGASLAGANSSVNPGDVFTAFGYLAQAVPTVVAAGNTNFGQDVGALYLGYIAGEGQGQPNLSSAEAQFTQLNADFQLSGSGSNSSDPSYSSSTIESWVSAAENSDPNSPLYTAMYPDKNNVNYHNYVKEDLIGTTEEGFTLENVYAQLLWYAGPAQPTIATNFDDQNLFYGLLGQQHITQLLNPSASFDTTTGLAPFTVENITLADHIFAPGNVKRTVVQKGDGIYIDTLGTGTGNFPDANDFVGKSLFFPILDYTIRQNILHGINP